jgi:hypothetical protein
MKDHASMSNSAPKRKPQATTVFIGIGEGRFTLINGLKCPACGETLRASDAKRVRPGLALYCFGCHAEIFREEPSE